MPRAKKVLAATAGVAAAAGLALAVHKKGRSGHDEQEADAVGGAGGARVFHVVPSGDGWAVELEGSSRPESRHGTKREAIDTARAAAHAAAPSGLVIHRADGTIQRRHGYDAG